MTMASRLAVMSEGRLLQVGAPAEIYETPANRFVADFIGNVNLMDGRLVEDEPGHVVVECADVRHWIGHGITGTLNMPVTIALRPEKIRIGAQPPPALAGEPGAPFNRVSGTVKDLAYFGSHTVYHLALPSGAVLKVSQSNVERETSGHLDWGDTAWAAWSPRSPVVLTS